MHGMHGLQGYYTLREVCALTTLSPRTIGRLIDEGRFPKPDRMSKRRNAWLKKDVHRWMALRDRWRPPNDGDNDDEDDGDK